MWSVDHPMMMPMRILYRSLMQAGNAPDAVVYCLRACNLDRSKTQFRCNFCTRNATIMIALCRYDCIWHCNRMQPHFISVHAIVNKHVKGILQSDYDNNSGNCKHFQGILSGIQIRIGHRKPRYTPYETLLRCFDACQTSSILTVCFAAQQADASFSNNCQQNCQPQQ